jgi:hypothetical protein
MAEQRRASERLAILLRGSDGATVELVPVVRVGEAMLTRPKAELSR